MYYQRIIMPEHYDVSCLKGLNKSGLLFIPMLGVLLSVKNATNSVHCWHRSKFS